MGQGWRTGGLGRFFNSSCCRGSRAAVIEKMSSELLSCRAAGGNTTLMVWADLDHDRDNGEALKADFWQEAQQNGISNVDFAGVVFIFAKDRLENWVEFLQTGKTDEFKEGPRVKHNRIVADAAKKLADFCKARKPLDGIPPSLQWSCENWHVLARRLK